MSVSGVVEIRGVVVLETHLQARIGRRAAKTRIITVYGVVEVWGAHIIPFVAVHCYKCTGNTTMRQR